MTTFDRTWDTAYEGLPPDTEQRSLGAQRIRNMKVDVREREAVDHSWAGDANDGKHYRVTLRLSTVDPVLDATDGAVYAKAIAGNTELFYEDSAGAVAQLTNVGGPQNVFSVGVVYFGAASVGFFAASTGVTGNYISFAPGGVTYIMFNTVANRFEFYVNGVLAGHMP